MSRKINIRSFFREISARTFKSPLVTVRLVPGEAHKPGQISRYSYYVENVQEKYWNQQPLRIRPLCRLQISATKYTTTKRHIPEQRRTQIQPCRSQRPLNILIHLSINFHMASSNILLVFDYEVLYAVINPLKAKLSRICHLLALLGAHHILHASRIRVNYNFVTLPFRYKVATFTTPIPLAMRS